MGKGPAGRIACRCPLSTPPMSASVTPTALVAVPLDETAPDTRLAVDLLGALGQMIAGSKSGYHHLVPDHLVVFNANVCTQDRPGGPGVLWYGDLDVTASRADLRELAGRLGQHLYICYEMGASPRGDRLPDFQDAAYDTDGVAERYRVAAFDGVVPSPEGRRNRRASETEETRRITPPLTPRTTVRRRVRRPRFDWRTIHSAADPQPQGPRYALPDLTSLVVPVVRGHPDQTAACRLEAWYAALTAQLAETVPPFCSAVWLHPADDVALRQWVGAPLRRRYPAFRQEQMMGMFWLSFGPATSIHVPEGTMIIEPDACDRTRSQTTKVRGGGAPGAPSP